MTIHTSTNTLSKHNTANMVHLGKIPTDKDVAQPLVEGISSIDLGSGPSADEFTSSVYGSSFASRDLPRHEMPEGEMPKDIAYRMIK